MRKESAFSAAILYKTIVRHPVMSLTMLQYSKKHQFYDFSNLKAHIDDNNNDDNNVISSGL